MLFCISVRCTAKCLDNHILYKVIPIFPLPTWHHNSYYSYYNCQLFFKLQNRIYGGNSGIKKMLLDCCNKMKS